MVKCAGTAEEQLLKPCRKLLQIKSNVRAQYKKKKRSITRALLDYLTSDSFMYGPLLYPPPKRPALSLASYGAPDPFAHRTPPALSHSEGTKTARDKFPHHTPTPSHNEDDAGATSMVTGLYTPPTPVSSTLHRMSTFTRKLLWRSTTTVSNDGNESGASPRTIDVQHKHGEEAFLRPPFKGDRKVIDEHEENGDGNLTDQVDEGDDDDESSKSFMESQTENDVSPLHKEAAMEVVRRLVRKVGGRISKELGIFVDIRDSEAERWFLATTFLSHPSDFDLAKQMHKKLQAMGITKIQDILGFDQSELEEAFQNVMQNQRIASRLQKIALGLHSEHAGGICTLKRISDYAELKRNLENLPGYSRSSAHMFLREMRGIWPGASPEFELRTTNAAKHLHLLASVKDGVQATLSLVELAQGAGLDERDLEVALVKLSFQHARQYRSCVGGRECEFATITLSDLDHLIMNL